MFLYVDMCKIKNNWKYGFYFIMKKEMVKKRYFLLYVKRKLILLKN